LTLPGTSEWSLLPGKNLPGFYGLLAQGFLAGQLSLLVQPDPKLLALPDPYDPAQNWRYRLHDAALFHGKYYLYYGPAPALLVFAPFRLLTGYDFPESSAVALFCSTGLLFSFLLLRLLCRTYLPDTPFWLLVAFVPALAFGNIAPFLLRRPAHYEVAISCGYALVFASLYCFASTALQQPLRKGFLLLSSLLLGLAVGARFPMLAASLAPFALFVYWFFFKWRASPVRNRVALGLVMFEPLAACLFLLGLYNYVRFGSWTDFGLRHTLQGIIGPREYTFFDPTRIPTSFFYYVLAPPLFIRDFPFVRLAAHNYLAPPAGYVLERIAGVLPMVPLLSVLLPAPFWLRTLRRSNPALLFVAVTSLIIGSAPLALYCLSGGTMRYEVDYATFFLIPALLVWCAGLHALRDRPRLHVSATAAFVILLALTVALNGAISLTGYYDNLERASPRTYQAIRTLFSPIENVLR